ncbi:4-hydroxy-2-oxoglutarate aldolase, mitochondrial [Parasteatoda tepidariorum]|uniref:4-hydroxy-2-oxoglutarate aldolase, mitochondrial n=1 Tax=Parasteatoda tepidariorum TaxID=114398 RepID=UPI001C717F54|nr:4-hydroxy-2-oxoglutarate aldolase, mitochondrial [Parasteatoda tepidariorum]
MFHSMIRSTNLIKYNCIKQPFLILNKTRRLSNSSSYERFFSATSSLDLSGIYPPIITPFDEKFNINFDKLSFNLNVWNSTSFKGYVVLGSTGEFPFLSEKNKIHLVKHVKKESEPHKIIIAGTGCESTTETIDLTNKMADAGAAAALVVSPFFYKGRMTDDLLYDHYIKVADSSKIPIILYSVPANTGIDLSATLAASLADHSNIIGMKDSGGDISKIGFICHKTKGKNFQVLAGSAGFLYPALCVGCVGGVLALANALGSATCQLYENFISGKHEEARELQLRLIGPNLAVTKWFGIPGVKAAMDMLNYQSGLCHPPLKSLTAQELSKLKNEFVINGFL